MSSRIALITATPQSVAAGSGTFVATENLRLGLARLGYDVTVIHPGWSQLPRQYAIKRWLFNRRLDPRQLADTRLVIGIDLDGFAVADKIGAPFIAYIHGQLADEARFERGLTRWSMLLQGRWERLAAERATQVITISAYASRRVAALYAVDPARIAVVPPGFDVDGWAARVDAAHGGRVGAPTVLAVAHLYPRKNLVALIDAAAALKRRGVHARVRIVGHGPERRRLERRIRERNVGDAVELVGFVPEDRLPAEFAMADVFCLPSLQEGFGIVFVQAMAAGLPIVAVRASSTPEIVRHDIDGLLAHPRDHDSLADALETMLRDPDRARFGDAGRQRARGFGIRRVAERLMTVVSPERERSTDSRGM